MEFIVMVAVIAALGWLAIIVLLVGETLLLTRFRTQAQDTRRTRRLETQVTLGRRVVVALIVTLALAGLLLTIPEVRALGTGILASAGLISIVAGLAVQSSLTNVFAGVQLAFTDAIRIDDVVVVEKLWGKIEEITMTYVVVRVWDERMLILPSTYFTTTPFENWTRTNSKIMGTVELDLDWQVPVAQLRAHLALLLDSTDLWDRRTGSLQVTDATGDFVRLRILVSAADSGALWDLRCLVRESMLEYLQTSNPWVLPRHRWQSVQPGPDDDAAPTAEREEVRTGTQSGHLEVAAGDAERKQLYSGPGGSAFEERASKSAGNPA
ncbi:mechanosensitive ion channel family protein [Paenarthrobacter sp. Z7-10]|uniref:mechanosensitive ion channel family protein n=1 Tax=Paenarthrobacter sp. Z7-10 TaxID=2787635 RepID=UPI0022A9D0E6|nr:mechanosensitive ion channel domain-containing protein [Paenarthrobacter sp. Z7-10]